MPSSNRIGIIGAGPAGVACAVQLARAGVKPILFDPGLPGGSLRQARWVENFPGFPRGISGMDLAERIKDALQCRSIPVRRERVIHLKAVGDELHIQTDSGRHAFDLVVAGPGVKPLDLPEDIVTDPSIRSRITQFPFDLPMKPGAPTAILGGGDVAFDYALRLAESGAVHLFYRSGLPRAIATLVSQSQGRAIFLHPQSHLRRITPGPSGLRLHFQDGRPFDASSLLVAIGRQPDTQFISPQLLKGETGKGRFYLVGDAAHPLFRHATIAAGDGLRAAVEILQSCR